MKARLPYRQPYRPISRVELCVRLYEGKLDEFPLETRIRAVGIGAAAKVRETPFSGQGDGFMRALSRDQGNFGRKLSIVLT